MAVLGSYWRRRVETHNRVVLRGSAAILEAAGGRLRLRVVVECGPCTFYAGGDLIILAGILCDLTSRGRVHPVWIWGGGALVASQFVRVAIMDTAPWLAFAHAMADLV